MERREIHRMDEVDGVDEFLSHTHSQILFLHSTYNIALLCLAHDKCLRSFQIFNKRYLFIIDLFSRQESPSFRNYFNIIIIGSCVSLLSKRLLPAQSHRHT